MAYAAVLTRSCPKLHFRQSAHHSLRSKAAWFRITAKVPDPASIGDTFGGSGSPTQVRSFIMNSWQSLTLCGFRLCRLKVDICNKRKVATSMAVYASRKVGDLIGHRPPEVRSTVGKSTKANSLNRARNRQNISHECHARNLDSSFYSNNGGFISPSGSIRETLLPVPPPSPDGVSLLQERDGYLAGVLSLPFSAPAFFFSTQNNNSHLGLSPGSQHANNPGDRT